MKREQKGIQGTGQYIKRQIIRLGLSIRLLGTTRYTLGITL